MRMRKMKDKKDKPISSRNVRVFLWMRYRLILRRFLKTSVKTWMKVLSILILQVLSYILYTTCVSHPTLPDFLNNKKIVVIQAFFSVVFTVTSLDLVIFVFKMKWMTNVFLLVTAVINIYLMWNYDQLRADGVEFHYGYWAARGYVALVFGFLGVSLFVFVFYKVIRMFRISIRSILITVGSIGGIFFLYIAFVYSSRKATFDEGLFGVNFDESKAICRVNNDVLLVSRLYPKYFFHHIFLSHWCTPDREFVTITGDNDPRGKTTTIIIDPKKISAHMSCSIELFPNIHDNYEYDELRNYDEDSPWWTVTVLQKYFFKKMKKIDPIEVNKPFTYDAILYETVLVRCGHYGNIIVNPKRKYDDRKGVHDVSPKHPNIILLWFDSEARKAFEYDFPLSIKYMKDHILNQKKKDGETKKYEFYQFFSHYVIGWNTYPQFLCMFNGIEEKNMSTILWETAKQNGWITVYSDDECNEASSRYNKQKLLFDYTHLEPYCLEEYTDPTDHFSVFKGPLAVGRRCLFQYEGPQYIFEYFKKIENIYPEKSKFFYAMFDEAHEGTGESVRYIDRYLLDYLKFLNEKGALDHTVIYFFADHGNHMSIVLNMFKEGRVGGMNPMLYMLAPSDYTTEEQKKNLEVNQHRLITAYDLHKTWSGMIDSKAEWNVNGLDFINEEVPYDRNCESAAIPRCYSLACKEGDKFVPQE